MSREILKDIIEDFQTEKFIRFFRVKNNKFRYPNEPLPYEEDNFQEPTKIAEVSLEDGNLLICSFLVKQPLSERSGKKAQYELGKKILKESQTDAGIFIFYDAKGNFRFSLIYTNYLGRRRDWSAFRRFTYFVSPELTNKTFLNQIGEGDFSSLEKIKGAFSVEKVTKEFYQEIFYWYLWAMDKVEFPDDEDKKREIRNAKNLIRLITRIIFVWFMKVKKLIPETLFDKNFIDKVINYKDINNSTYYKAILQNLFFATLNTQMKKDDSKSRLFIEEAKHYGFVSEAYLQQGFYRYSKFIKDKNLFLEQFKDIPFLNGGLFDSLDRRIDKKEIRVDCFSDNSKNEGRLKVPDELFFKEEKIDVDLGKHLEPDSKRKIVKKVRGLIPILKSYNFTIDENTPVDEEVALEPELLGKVFENLLASYNPETKTTARKATGSYYTPREIVEYMVNESIIAYIKTALSNETKEFEEKLRSLLDYNIEINPFENEKETTKKIIEIIESVKILDPACGSGAFPMGILHKLVLILHKLDPENKYWYELQFQKAIKETEEAFKVGDKKEREERLKEINDAFDKNITEPNYARKLFLIRNCIHGIDIQEIAVQISKLRFFISLLIDQQTDDAKPNRGIKALPNLETKFAAANTLIGLNKLPEELFDTEISKIIIKELFKVREDFFYANSRWKKKELEEKEKKLKESLIESMQKNLQKINEEKIKNIKIEIEKLNKELNNLSGQADEMEIIEIQNLFGEKEIKRINKTEQKRQEIKRRKLICESELKMLENPREEPSIEIAKKITEFNPYDQNKSNSWFDPEWMFGIKDGFDIVIANPPYGNLLKDNEKRYVEINYKFSKSSDISSPFVEKGINLLKDKGNLIYIITYAITFNKDFSGNRQHIFNTFEESHIYSFDRDRCRIFESMTQTVSILKCFNKNSSSRKGVFTSRMFRETPNINEIEVTNCDKYLLPKGSKYNQKHRLPKIGEETNRQILDKLLLFNDNVGSIIKNSSSKIWIRTSGNYWYNAFDRKPYNSVEITPLYIEKDYTNFIILLMNLSLFYFWFRIYGDGRHMNTDILGSFPLPNREKICKYHILLNKVKEKFMHKLFSVFEKERNRFITSSIKSEIDLLDLILGKYFYNLDYNEIIHILNYDSEIRGGNKLDKPFVNLVDKILAITKNEDYLKSQTKQSKVKEYERQIDQMVYQLYGLTKEEIKIVEGFGKQD